jgi:hypothetical protein
MLASKNKINSISMHYEMEEPSEYYRFYSKHIEPKDKHVFTFKVENNSLVVEESSDI